MRWAMVIIAMAAVAMGVVHVERELVRHRYEMRQSDREYVRLRRALWDQQVQLGQVTSPTRIRQLVEAHSLNLADRATEGRDVLTSAARVERPVP